MWLLCLLSCFGLSWNYQDHVHRQTHSHVNVCTAVWMWLGLGWSLWLADALMLALSWSICVAYIQCQGAVGSWRQPLWYSKGEDFQPVPAGQVCSLWFGTLYWCKIVLRSWGSPLAGRVCGMAKWRPPCFVLGFLCKILLNSSEVHVCLNSVTLCWKHLWSFSEWRQVWRWNWMLLLLSLADDNWPWWDQTDPCNAKLKAFFFWIFYMSARGFSGCHFSSSGRALVSNQLLWLRSLWGILQIPLLSAQPSCILCVTFQAWGCSFPVLNAHANVFASKPHTPKWWHLSRFLPKVAQEKMMYMITCRSLDWLSIGVLLYPLLLPSYLSLSRRED